MNEEFSHHQSAFGDYIAQADNGGIAKVEITQLPQLKPITTTAPAPPPNFVGRRRDIDSLAAALTRGQSTVITALQGMGGIGKTAIAQKIAVELTPHFTGGIFWGSLADSTGNPNSILRTWIHLCAHRLLEEIEPDWAEIMRGLFRERLTQQGPLLVIIDDVRPEWLDGARLLRRAIPSGVPLLLTTRNQEIAVALDAQIHYLDVLKERESLALLANFVGDQAIKRELPAAKQLVLAVGNLPLAIELAGKRLSLIRQKPGFSLVQFTSTVINRASETLSLSGHHGLAATFFITYDDLSSQLQYLFRWLGVIVPGKIWVTHVAGLFEITEIQAEQSLEALVLCAFLHRGETPGEYTLHPLLHQYAYQILQASGEFAEAAKRHLNYFLSLLKHDGQSNPRTRKQPETVIQNISLATDRAISNKDIVSIQALNIGLQGSIFIFHAYGYLNDAFVIVEKIQAIYNDTNNGEEARVLSSLGAIYKDQGNYVDAEKCYQKALKIYEQLNHHLAQAATFYNLGMVLSLKGEYVIAEEYLYKASQIYNESDSLSNRALIFSGLGTAAIHKKDYNRAKSYLENALNLYLQVGNSQSLGIVLENLGIIEQKMENYAQAITYFQQALDSYIKLGSLVDQISCLLLLTNTNNDSNNLDSAKQFYERAFHIYTQLDNQLDQVRLLEQLRQAAEHQGDVASVKRCCEQALHLYTSWNNYNQQAQLLSDLGFLAYKQEEYSSAVERYREACQVYKQAGNLSNQAWALTNLAAVMLQDNNDTLAKQCYFEAAELYTKQNDTRSLASIYCKLGKLALKQNVLIESTSFYAKAYELYSLLGELKEMGSTLEWLGKLAQMHGELELANQYNRQALNCYTSLDSPYDEARVLENLASLATRLQRWNAALRFYKYALEKYTLLDDLTAKAETLVSIGDIAGRMNDYNTAEQFFQLALTIFEQKGELEGQADTLTRLGFTAYDRYNYDRALERFTLAYDYYHILNNILGLMDTTIGLGKVLTKQDKFKAAEQHFKRVINWAEQEKRGNVQINMFMNLGWLAAQQFAYSKSRRNYKMALKLATKNSENWLIPEIHNELAMVEQRRKKYKRARSHLMITLHQHELLNSLNGQAWTLWELGRIAAAEKNYIESEQFLKKAYILFKELDESRGAAHAEEYLGVTYMLQGRHKLAEELIKRSLAEHNRRGEWKCQRHANFHFGLVAKKQRKFTTARKYYLKSLQIAIKLRYFYIQVETQLLLCLLELQIGNLLQARRYYRQLVSYFRQRKFRVRFRLFIIIYEAIQQEDDFDFKKFLKLLFESNTKTL